jgi:hypothetical protein
MRTVCLILQSIVRIFPLSDSSHPSGRRLKIGGSPAQRMRHL